MLLLPFQVSVLGTPSPAVTPTNLLYNVVATPGALYRYWRQRQTGGRLALVLIAGTVPGVIAGSVIRVELLPGPASSTSSSPRCCSRSGCGWPSPARPGAEDPAARERFIPTPVLSGLAAVVGCVGGIYGIGGGSILAPILIGSGRPPAQVAPAALASTFVTSVAGVVTFTILSVHQHGPVAPALVHRDRARHRRPGWRLHRSPDPVPPSGRPDPTPGRHPGHRHRRPLPVGRPELIR